MDRNVRRDYGQIFRCYEDHGKMKEMGRLVLFSSNPPGEGGVLRRINWFLEVNYIDGPTKK